MTRFCDPEERGVLLATPARDAATSAEFAKVAAMVAMPGRPLEVPYQAGVHAVCPNTVVSIDPFHIVTPTNKVLDEVHRAEVKREVDLKGSRLPR